MISLGTKVGIAKKAGMAVARGRLLLWSLDEDLRRGVARAGMSRCVSQDL
jgi:hypothetical protein